MTTNQLIGFEGRKKECAVMISTSMSKKTLSGILFGEMLITSITSATVGCTFGALLTVVIEKAVNAADNIYMPVEVHLSTVVTLWVIMCVVFALTVLFPIKNMRKMKLSEQLKYE
jgi:ABC-type antimicrobial peptide transport system permease subunit